MSKSLIQKAITVSECVDLIRTSLQATVGELRVRGEVSEFQKRSHGSLVFFSLKDEQSYLRCFMLEHEVKVQIEDGMEIEVIGHPSLFKKNAGFHIRVRRIEVVGEGALQKQLEMTKKKLEKEGLFLQERKRPVPAFPQSIGIITSEDAAALTDVRRVLQNRWPYVTLTLVSSQVQGRPAIKQLIRAFNIMCEHVRPDLIILTRGGGSLEDLQAFNSEELARVIFSSTLPVVVGVGHERDWTIADFVADVRAATPSNAAELATPHKEDVALRIDALIDGLEYTFQHLLQAHGHNLSQMSSVLFRSMDMHAERLRSLFSTMTHAGARFTETLRHMLQNIMRQKSLIEERLNASLNNASDVQLHAQKLLESYSPRNVLKRGFTITRRGKKIIRSSKDISKRDILRTTFHDGDVDSEVT